LALMPATTELIFSYQSNLDSAGVGDNLVASEILSILLLRDRLDAAESITVDEFLIVSELDERLRQLAPRIVKQIPSATLSAWRNSAGKRSASWWWHLDTVAAYPKSGWWALAAAALVTITLALLATIVSRFFEGGPDTIGALAVTFQGVLTVLAGAAAADFTAGKLDALLARWGIAPANYGRARFAFALAVFVLVLSVRLSLPLVAVAYNNAGAEARKRNDYSAAIAAYTRAIALKPDFPPALFSLAEVYENSLDYDRAIASYQSAIRVDARLYDAYNNLARLQILAKQNCAGALQLLDSALQLKPGEQHVLFVIQKNRAWANLCLKNYREAEADLGRAQAYQPGSAIPHCLLAQVKQAQGAADAARAESIACLKMDPALAEPYWLEFASDQVEAGNKK
jgi:tetratricopeptide (TPR) repeat protein